jgi:NTE family protein
MIAAGCSAEELTAAWLDPVNATIIPRAGVLRQMARELFAHFRPRVPFGLTVVEVPRMRVRLVRDSEITWQHLAAACSIPLLFPPVRIDGASYVDGGLLGTLPLWAASEMGATRAIAVNALTALPFRALRWALPPRRPSPTIEIVRIEPPTPLGSMTDAVRWSRASTLRLIEQGERDATRVCTSITM